MQSAELPAIPSELLARRLRNGTMRVVDDELEKQCPRCREWWPCDSEFFFRYARNQDGLKHICKACCFETRNRDGEGQLPAPSPHTEVHP